jgi:ribosomal protein S12 methylthiotransferase
MKQVHIINLGCSKNLVDAESILGDFYKAGYSLSPTAQEASIVVVNTCGFIADAKEESINEILSHAQNKQPHQKLVVAGCLSKRYMDELPQEMPEVDLFVGTYNSGEILQALGESITSCDHVPARVMLEPGAHHAYVKIAEGCNRACSFCAIPGIRGKQVSRPIEDIVTEIQHLHASGVQEVSLVAQDLTYYGREQNAPTLNGQPAHLSQLLQSIIAHTQVPWIRLMYAYPAFIDDELINTIASEPRICKYLDMPIQHASDRILKHMHRGHTAESLRAILQKLRQKIPGIALRTTVLTGFPGETEQDLQELLSLMEEIRFDRLGVFPYSPEEGTPAEELAQLQQLERVPNEVAQRRMNTIMELQQMISLERNQQLIGKELTVLIDEVAEGSEFHFYARTEWDAPEIDNQVQILDGNAQPGTFCKVQIVDAYEYEIVAKFSK